MNIYTYKKALCWGTLLASLLVCSTTHTATQSSVQKFINDFNSAITNFTTDKRPYTQAVEDLIRQIKANIKEFQAYFKKHHPTLTVEGFITALEAAKKATNAFSAGNALKRYYELLPSHMSMGILLKGINQRMKMS